VVKTLTLELLRGMWLIHEPAVHLYAQMAHDVLAGKKIDTSLFGELELPEVPENVALVTIAGPLTKSDICGSAGSRTLSKQMLSAANNPDIASIILLSESCPGGQVDGIEEFGNSIIAAKKKKPVLGAISGMSCSGGVWLQVLTNEWYATSQTDMVGCIGVMAKMKNPKKVDAENADIVEVYSDLSPDKNIEDRDANAYKQQRLNPVAELFHNTVMAGRGDRLKLKKENVLSGKTYMAAAAEENGLIDGVMPFNKIVARSLFLARTQKQKK
jgi:ClpP class serine protease